MKTGKNKTAATTAMLPPKGATPAQIKAWVADCQKSASTKERAEYEQTGVALDALLRRISR